MIIRRCVPEDEQSKILQECHAYILQETKQPTKFSSLDFFGLQFLRTVLNG